MRNIIKVVEQFEATKLTVDQTMKKIREEVVKIRWEDQEK